MPTKCLGKDMFKMTYCLRSIVFTNEDLFHNLQLPRQNSTYKTSQRTMCGILDIIALETPGAFLLQQGYKAIIISGGLNSVYAVDALLYDPAIFMLRSFSAGNFYGKQIPNKELGGTVERKDVRDGQFEIQVEMECLLFKGLETRHMVLLTHGDSVDRVAEGLRCVVKSLRHIISAIAEITESSSMI
ncbi:GMP synthase [glutamine-hydrolyzing]-like [Daphnia magna]|uniref:GMP synthase [glutamine-hydrolyzing]-like n=1 Tax=Daphnia magna TaxID=35525 RepID=UPI001E1BB53C|nr:GMP synthase [glutamine-hydrolyzing]-like [Daphnia magna]